jgi:hypothetical protein
MATAAAVVAVGQQVDVAPAPRAARRLAIRAADVYQARLGKARLSGLSGVDSLDVRDFHVPDYDVDGGGVLARPVTGVRGTDGRIATVRGRLGGEARTTDGGEDAYDAGGSDDQARSVHELIPSNTPRESTY